MPVAAPDFDDEPCPREDDIVPTVDAFEHTELDAIAQASPVKFSPERDFGLCVAAADARHLVGSGGVGRLRRMALHTCDVRS